MTNIRRMTLPAGTARTLLLPLLFLGLAATALAGTVPGGGPAVPDYSLAARKDVPVEYTWKLEDLYATPEDWKADLASARKLMGDLDGASRDWNGSAKGMLALLDLLNTLRMKLERLHSYASHHSNADLEDPVYQGMKGELTTLRADLGAKTAFLADDVLKLGAEKFEAFARDEPRLQPYRFGIREILRGRDHVLPPAQQEIVALTALFSGSFEKASSILNDVEIPPAPLKLSDGRDVSLNYATYFKLRGGDRPEDRLAVMTAFLDNQRKFESTNAALLDGSTKQHYFKARAHKFPTCLESRLFRDNISPGVYHQLIRSVRENLSPLHRYITLKKKILGLPVFRYPDLFANAVPAVEKTYAWDEAKGLCTACMKPLGPEYQAVLEKAFSQRWIDRYPNKGKESGAYSEGCYGVHPFVKMNYDGSYDSLSTLAHELGHALHSDFSCRAQHFTNADYPTFLAEVASTFNENLLVQHVLQTETDDRFKLYVLDRYLDRVRSTLYRQTLFAEFELLMHQRVEEGKTLTADWLDETYLRLTREYYGHETGVCEIGEYLSCEWDFVPHFYLDFYVFQYSTGIIASMALADGVLHGGAAERDRYLDFLRAGGSDHPLAILKKAGVDMSGPQPYEAALKRFDDLVSEMEKIVERLKK
ncbi:MAG: oligoendopeptidase F [Acidobacteria bacterium]|nr:oligoendopeptidase F [Acidobacteriota bacterium]